MKTYQFRVVIEPDGDRWLAFCPALVKHGAATWGYTRDEAVKHIREVLEMTLECMLEDGEAIPDDEGAEMRPASGEQVAVSL